MSRRSRCSDGRVHPAWVDGLVRRDLRRFGAGRESSYLYYKAHGSIIPLRGRPLDPLPGDPHQQLTLLITAAHARGARRGGRASHSIRLLEIPLVLERAAMAPTAETPLAFAYDTALHASWIRATVLVLLLFAAVLMTMGGGSRRPARYWQVLCSIRPVLMSSPMVAHRSLGSSWYSVVVHGPDRPF
ncbi:DUF4400 domain-containing protein [Pseudomonas aeruginosa]